MELIHLTPENTEKHSFFCIKNINAPGFKAKNNWFVKRYEEGLRLQLIYEGEKQIGFIEYVPSEFAWRPVKADGYLFIHCIFVYPNKYRSTGAASALINESVKYAKELGLNGICTMTSQRPWMATKNLFAKNGFEQVDKKGRFELMSMKLKPDTPDPELIDWENQLSNYKGWHLVYADQCPWHEKGVAAIKKASENRGIDLRIKKIETAIEAQNAPSGFGVFALIRDGNLLEDHYISKRRFETIIEKELT